MNKITFGLSSSEIEKAIRKTISYKNRFSKKCDLFISKLADEGYKTANVILTGHMFTGETAGSLRIENRGKTSVGNRYALVAQSQAILFFEFGAGIRYSGEKHPQASEFGMGPGTFPGKGNWDNEKGWWYPTDDARLIIKTDENGQGWGPSYGTPPYMPLYRSGQEMIATAEKIAKEVFTR